jgi:asparagine synthase (glutamine-hydrolysing)
MCGICGFVRYYDRAAPSILKKMADAIRHRGPDDEGYLTLDVHNNIKLYSGDESVAEIKNKYTNINSADNTNLAFGFRRLSILDLSPNGHQPMLTVDKQFAITFNGEIYNYKELRTELQQAGHRFYSESDTEVILVGYCHWGKNVLQHLNGMFAFAIYDSSKNKLFIARDRLGIKPLFYHLSAAGITWSSEIKSVLKADWVSHQVNWESLFENYQLQTTPSPDTCFEEIYSLEPGHWMELNITTRQFTKQQYWQIPVGKEPINITKQEAAEYLDKKLQSIVKMQLRSDVSVTSLMSGGIDSTTLTAICSKLHPDFHCYSLGFDGSGKGADELPQAQAMARMLGIRQHVHKIHSEDVVHNLDESLRHFEEPYVNLEPGIAASEYLHKQGYKVVINGLGADEVFGGYTHYLDYQNWLKRRKLFFLQALIPGGNDVLNRIKNYASLNTVLKYFINSRLGMKPFEIRQLANRPVISAGNLQNMWQGESLLNVPESLFYCDLKYYIGSHHVYRDDLSGMRHSVEMRYPYLDHELIDWVATLPMSIRYSTTVTKPLLKELARRYITTENLAMPKKGFNLPLDEWMKKDNSIQNYARAKLDDLEKRDIFNRTTIEHWWQKRNEGVYFSKIWQLVTTEVWLNEYAER